MYTPDPNEDKCCILASFHHTYMPLSTIRACGREVEVEERGGGEGEEGNWGRGVSGHTSLVVLCKSGSHFGISCGQPWGRGCWFDGLLSTEALSVTFFGQP